jgi:acylphosphatase
MPQIVRHLYVSGRVQGVGYRRAMAQQVGLLGLAGWVRNRFDGRLEALVFGEEEAVLRLIHWAGIGPTAAGVDCVDVSADDICPAESSGFVMRETV